MTAPTKIPPGLQRSEMDGWVRTRVFYINRFQINNWYPNCCLQARVDLSAADALRKRLNAEDPDPGRKITFNHIITKAVANALRNWILFNGKYARRDVLLIDERIHLANVVDTEGMATQIMVRDADRITLRELAAQMHRMISARRSTLRWRLDRLTQVMTATPVIDALFWWLPYLTRLHRDISYQNEIGFLHDRQPSALVTNPGTLGVQDCKAMLFFGQLLTCIRVMAIEEEAVLEAGRVRFRKLLPVGMDYDQRLTDAGPASRLLNEIRRNLEQPDPYSTGPAVENPEAMLAWPRGGGAP